MPADHFVVNAGDDVGNVERAGFARQVGVEQDLQQEIAEFLGQILGASLFDGVEDFVGFFDQVGFEGRVGLLAVPGAAAGGAQAGLDGDQVFKEFCRCASWWLCGDGFAVLRFVGAQTSFALFG